MNKWKEDEIDFMSVALKQGWTHKDIANELDRTSISVKHKASRLGLNSLNCKKDNNQYIDQLPNDILLLDNYINSYTKILHKHLVCNYTWKVRPNNILNGTRCPSCAGNINKTTEYYIKQLPKDIILLGNYINNYTKILHKHSCGFIWEAIPNNILTGKSCPKCNATFSIDKPAVTYLIYFPEYDLYKFGISNNYKIRMKHFGSKPEIIFIREFTKGSDARALETQWSESLDHLKINTGLLTSGNTETFKIKA